MDNQRYMTAFIAVAVGKFKNRCFAALCVILWVSLFTVRGNALQHTGKSLVILPGCVIPDCKQPIHGLCIRRKTVFELIHSDLERWQDGSVLEL